MNPPLLHTEGLYKSFAGRGLFKRSAPVRAVVDVSLTLNRGEAVGLVGESGSGKSTIGRLLLGLIAPSAGRVMFDGQDIAQTNNAARARLRQRLQLVFQDPYASLDPRRRIGAQIADGLEIHQILPDHTARQERVGTLLQEVGLSPAHANRFPHEFSGGQRQRIGLARALATQPDLLVADEPVSALDVSVQAQVLHLLNELRSRMHLSLLFISHDLHVVRSLCNRVVVLYLGRIVEKGPVRDVLESPKHPYTQALLSASPRLNGVGRSRVLLSGDPPSPNQPPSGCVFRTRCPIAIGACASSVPEFRNFGPTHQVACLRL